MQIRVIHQHQLERTVERQHVQGEVEFRLPVEQREHVTQRGQRKRDAVCRQTVGAHHGGRDVQQRLKYGIPGAVAGTAQRLHERTERHLVFDHAAERGIACRSEHRPKGGVGRHVQSQRQLIHEHADQIAVRRPFATVERRPDDQIALPREAVEHGGERGQHEHERCGALGLRERDGGGGAGRVEPVCDHGTREARLRAAAPICGQLQFVWRAVESGTPEVTAGGQPFRCPVAPLPHGELPVRGRQGKRRFAPIVRRKIAIQHAQRDAVHRDVMHRRDEVVPCRTASNQRGPEGRLRLERERSMLLAVHDRTNGGRLRLARQMRHVHHIEGNAWFCGNDQYRPAGALGDGGTERLVPLNHLPQCVPQAFDIKLAINAHDRREVVRRRRGIELLEQPQPLLTGSQRHGIAKIARHCWWCRYRGGFAQGAGHEFRLPTADIRLQPTVKHTAGGGDAQAIAIHE